MKIKNILIIILFFCFNITFSQENIAFYNLRDYVVQGQNYSSIITPKHKLTISLPLNVSKVLVFLDLITLGCVS